MTRELEPILKRFAFLRSGYQILPLGNDGGFSGSEVRRIHVGELKFCLKKWPISHPTRDHLAWIHQVLQHVAREGLSQIAVPMADDHGETIIEHKGVLYELTPWLPGEANFENQPSPEKLRAAMTVLAQIHQLAATYKPVGPGRSHGISERLEQWRVFTHGGFQIDFAHQRRDWPELAQLGAMFLRLVPRAAKFLNRELQRASPLLVPLQPCIRDVWHDHVLFTGDVVTGLIDFGAMRMENVAGDIARLVGSLVEDDPVQRALAIATYQELRPLSNVEQELISVFDHSAIVLGGLNWLRWIFIEHRTFANHERVVQRFRKHLVRLQHLVR